MAFSLRLAHTSQNLPLPIFLLILLPSLIYLCVDDGGFLAEYRNTHESAGIST